MVEAKAFERSSDRETICSWNVLLELNSNRIAELSPNRTEATMDDLPELPFEQVLSYLNLENRLRLSAVSRSCRQKIANHRVKSLCYSELPSGFIIGKSRWMSGAFAQNFISSTRFASFFDTFGPTILSSLKHLRLCDLDRSVKDQSAFTRTLNSFGQLEELVIVRVNCGQQQEFKLNLPMLTGIHLEQLKAARKLTLEMPRLQKFTILHCPGLRLDIVHNESVETSITSGNHQVKVTNFRNLKYLYVNQLSSIDSTFLSTFEQLKELHTDDRLSVSKLFEQKRRYARAGLKIYYGGLLLNGPDDPAIKALGGDLSEGVFTCFAENRSRLADEIPCYRYLHYYSAIEEVDVLKRCTELKGMKVYCQVQDIERFLDLLKNCNNIVEFDVAGVQPQDLFDRLPVHCAVQYLSIDRPPADLAFLFRLKHLIHLKLNWPIRSETVRKALGELPVLIFFEFRGVPSSGDSSDRVTIETYRSKRFRISVTNRKMVTISDLNEAIEFIYEKVEEEE